MAKPCYLKRGQYLFCSEECRKKSRFTALEERFRQNLGSITETGCLPWIGHTNKHGYGVISRGGRKGPLVLAHRLAYEKTNGPIRDGLCVLHRCDNPPCCNPDHLFLGTRAENMEDMDAKGRRRAGVGERHRSAKLTAEAVREIRARRKRDGTLYRVLAADYNVSVRAVRAVVAELVWKHVTPE